MNTPRNIIAIDRVRVAGLTGFKRMGRDSVQLDAATPWENLAIKVPARLTVSDKVEDGVRLFTAQLVFRTCEEPGELGRWAYRCRTADGRHILIGTSGRPYPVGTMTRSHPDNMTDSQLLEVSVSWTSEQPVPYIV